MSAQTPVLPDRRTVRAVLDVTPAPAPDAATTQWKLEPAPVLHDRISERPVTVAAAAKPAGRDQRLPKLDAPSKGPLEALAENVVIRRYGVQKVSHPHRDSNASLVDEARWSLRAEQRAPRCVFDRNVVVAQGGCDAATVVDAHLVLDDHVSIGGQGGRERAQFTALGGVPGVGNLAQKFGVLDVRYSAGSPGDDVRPYAEIGAGLVDYKVGFDGRDLPLGQRQSATRFMGRVTGGASVRVSDSVELDVGAEFRRGGSFGYAVSGAPNGALDTNAIRDDKRVFIRASVGLQSIDEIFGNWIG